VHGEGEAEKAKTASAALFSGLPADMEKTPAIEIAPEEAERGMGILDLLIQTKLVPSRAEAKRNIQQGGVLMNGERIGDIGLTVKDFPIMLQKGKKSFCRVIVK
jgi:tyrosyl-tRNA synthetase